MRRDRPRRIRRRGRGRHLAGAPFVHHRWSAGHRGPRIARKGESSHSQLGPRVPDAPRHREPCPRRSAQGRPGLRSAHRGRGASQHGPGSGVSGVGRLPGRAVAGRRRPPHQRHPSDGGCRPRRGVQVGLRAYLGLRGGGPRRRHRGAARHQPRAGRRAPQRGYGHISSTLERRSTEDRSGLKGCAAAWTWRTSGARST